MRNAMKKLILTMLTLGAAFGATAVAGDALLLFSSRGPDSYADGTPVQEGECYALVWTRDGVPFAGIDLNGRAVDTNNSAVVVALPLAKAGRRGVHCPRTLFQIDETFAKAHADGAFSLVLLDTRVTKPNGSLAPSGNPSRVNGWGFVTKSRVKALASKTSTVKEAEGDAGAVAAESSAIPAGEEIPQPKITGIEVRNGFVVLTVKGTSARLLYNVASGSHPGKLVNRRAAPAAVQGRERPDHEIKFVMPVREDGKFFRIIRN